MRVLALLFVFLVQPASEVRSVHPAAPAPGDTLSSRFLTTADGVKIHYLEAGQGPAILFVPGWTMPAEIWEHQLSHFAKTYRVVAIDPRSQGRSSKPAEGHFPAARARDIKAVVDQRNLAPVVLVGWSMAVGECVAFVDQFGTDAVAGLVLVDGVAGYDLDPEVIPQTFKWIHGFQVDRAGNAEKFVRSMYKKPQSEAYLQRLIDASLATPTHTAVALIVGSLAADHRPALSKIDKPTLIAVAPSPWMKAYEDLHARITGSRLEVFEEAGHALFVDEADRFNALLEEFLKSIGH